MVKTHARLKRALLPHEVWSIDKSGLIRPLGVMSHERVPAYPELPTYKEQGFNVTIANYRQVLARQRARLLK